MPPFKTFRHNPKVRYVKDADNPGDHHCHWPGCKKMVKPAVWGCREHWYMLPKALRDKIWAAFRPGQEVSKTPSAEYVAVAREVQAWIAANSKPPKPPKPQGDLFS